MLAEPLQRRVEWEAMVDCSECCVQTEYHICAGASLIIIISISREDALHRKSVDK
jgi:hypothetical protein